MATGTESTSPLVLDTSAYSWLRSGHEVVLDRVAAADVVCIPSVVLGELHAGFELGERQRENTVVLEEFLAEPFIVVHPVTRRVAVHYGRIFANLRRAGTPIPINDVWIAATTLDTGGSLLSFDRHFESVPGLDCQILDA